MRISCVGGGPAGGFCPPCVNRDPPHIHTFDEKSSRFPWNLRLLCGKRLSVSARPRQREDNPVMLQQERQSLLLRAAARRFPRPNDKKLQNGNLLPVYEDSCEIGGSPLSGGLGQEPGRATAVLRKGGRWPRAGPVQKGFRWPRAGPVQKRGRLPRAGPAQKCGWAALWRGFLWQTIFRNNHIVSPSRCKNP